MSNSTEKYSLGASKYKITMPIFSYLLGMYLITVGEGLFSPNTFMAAGGVGHCRFFSFKAKKLIVEVFSQNA